MDWIGITCWAVMGLAAAMVLWALLWDRARGRLRCRRCAYDMSGGQLVCPECGREHSSERGLRRTRRKWKTAVFGLLLVGLSLHVKHQRHLIFHEGPIGLVPTIALVLLVDIDEYCQYRFTYQKGNLAVVEALEHRMYKMRTSLFSRRLLSRRLAEYWDRKDGAIVRAYDVSGIVPVVYSRPTMFYNSHRGTNRKNELMGDPRSSWDLYDTLVYHAAELYPEYEIEWVGDVGDQWVVSASHDGHVWIDESLRQIQRNCWSVGDAPGPLNSVGTQVYIRYDLGIAVADDDRAKYLWLRQIDSVVEKSRELPWLSDGGFGEVCCWIKNNQFIIWATPDHHREIMEYFNSIDLETLANQ